MSDVRQVPYAVAMAAEVVSAAVMAERDDGYVSRDEERVLEDLYRSKRSKLTSYGEERMFEDFIWKNMDPDTRRLMKDRGWFRYY